LLLVAQSALILQPTYTAEQKRQGTLVHAALNNFALLCFISGLVMIELNKFKHNGIHFESPHAILGLITYILLFLQAAVGVTQYFTPQLYGGVDNAKKLYKYHRMSGYFLFTLMLVTVCAATRTTYNVGVLHIQTWAVVATSLLTLVGIVPRIKKQKLGL
jgi:cytochrome b561